MLVQALLLRALGAGGKYCKALLSHLRRSRQTQKLYIVPCKLYIRHNFTFLISPVSCRARWKA